MLLLSRKQKEKMVIKLATESQDYERDYKNSLIEEYL